MILGADPVVSCAHVGWIVQALGLIAKEIWSPALSLSHRNAFRGQAALGCILSSS